ncbi:MAG TPA: GxxExxY protein [Phycisphaerales bacterium]|nr:GxxExxY protein [Phycisphaerales bacterium]
MGGEPTPEKDRLTREVIGAAIEVHRHLGPGLLESVYEVCLAKELGDRGMRTVRQVALPVIYKGERLDAGLRIDLLVADTVIVEVKSVESTHPIHEAQLLTYMRLAERGIGLLINFNTKVLHEGVKRRILSEFLTPSPPSSALSASQR